MKPTLDKSLEHHSNGVEWAGWHGFRRGLASNLFALGVTLKVIPGMTRHESRAITLQHYIKTPESETLLAMEMLESTIRNRPSGLISNDAVVVQSSSHSS